MPRSKTLLIGDATSYVLPVADVATHTTTSKVDGTPIGTGGMHQYNGLGDGAYVAFVRAGGSPASTDEVAGQISAAVNVPNTEIDSSELASELATILAGTTIYVDSPIFSGANNENLEVEQGDEYSENPTRITIDSATDFVGKKLVLAARLATLTSTKMALSMTIKLDGVSGDQYAEFAPTAAITELWTPGTYELRHRIELAPNKFRTLKRGTLTVRPFDTPSPIVDVDPPA